MGQAAPQRFGCHVDQLDLLGVTHDVVGNGLALLDAGDPLDDVVDRFEVLNVDRGDHVDASGEQRPDVLPPFGVAGARHIGVGEFVDEHDLGMAGQNRVEVHLLECRPPIVEAAARHDLEVGELLGGAGAAVSLDVGNDHVGAAVAAAATLVQHREGLSDARRGAEVDPQCSPRHCWPRPCRERD